MSSFNVCLELFFKYFSFMTCLSTSRTKKCMPISRAITKKECTVFSFDLFVMIKANREADFSGVASYHLRCRVSLAFEHCDELMFWYKHLIGVLSTSW